MGGKAIERVRNAEDAVENDLLRTMADAMPQLAWIAHTDGSIHWYNRRWYEYTGATARAMEGWGWQSVHAPDMLPQVLERWKTSIATGQAFEMEFPLRGAEGQFRRFLTRVVPLKDADGRVMQWFGTHTDVEELKRGEEALRKSERRFRTAFEHGAIPMTMSAMDGRLLKVNSAFCEMLGYTEAEVSGRNFADFMHADDPGESRAGIQGLVGGEALMLRMEKRFVRKDGGIIWVDMSTAVVRDAQGTALYMVTHVQDITERKEAEARLRGSEARMSGVVNAAIDGIITIDERGMIESVNPAASQVFGYSAAELMGQNVKKLMPEPERSRHDEHIRRYTTTGERKIIGIGREVVGQRKDGSVFPLHLGISEVRLGERRIFTGIIRDLTKSKRAEELLSRTNEQLRLFAEHAPAAIAMLDVQMCYVTVSQRWLSDHRLSGQDVRGRSHYEVFPELSERWKEIHRRCLGGAVERAEEDLFPRVDGGMDWMRWEIHPWRGGDGEIRGIIIFSELITERKRAQEELEAAKLSAERAKEAAEAASKAKDNFIAVLSHELRTPLTPILTAASMLRNDPRFDADSREQLEMIYRNAELEARLIDDLLDVTRIERGKVELDLRPSDLETIIRRAVEVCRPDIESRKVEFGIEAADGPYWVDGDAARLQQVLWNLLKNAIKFTPKGGCVGIRCRRDGEGWVVMEVHDNGIGMEPATLGRIFNAFEQAERSITRQFGGMGLGLTISKALVELHGGSIQASSEGKGKGATFTVRLPLLPTKAGEAAIAPPGAGPEAKVRSRRLRILLVEDHVDTARSMCRLLSGEGHEVEIAADVASAVALAQRQGFDLLLSDLGLPDGSGLDLLRELRARGVDLPGIAISGYGQEKDIEASREAGFGAHLTKPVSLPKLEEEIARVVGGSGAKGANKGQGAGTGAGKAT